MSDSKARSQEQYTRHAEGYVTSQTHAKGADLARLVAIAKPQPDWHMLDVATGGGHTALTFAPHVAGVIATDLTSRMLDVAQQHIHEKGVTNITFQQADAENLPFEAATFDLVTCRIAPHHFPDVAQFVREGARVLKTGGLLLVQDHVVPDDWNSARYVDAFETLRDPSHHRGYSASEWQQLFADAGFDVTQLEYVTKQHDFLTWAERQGCSVATVERLIALATVAPPIAREWLQAENFGKPDATFINHHIIIAGTKA